MITRDHIIVIARIFFGAVYFVFGLNYFVHIINLHGYYGLPEDALLEPMFIVPRTAKEPADGLVTAHSP